MKFVQLMIFADCLGYNTIARLVFDILTRDRDEPCKPLTKREMLESYYKALKAQEEAKKRRDDKFAKAFNPTRQTAGIKERTAKYLNLMPSFSLGVEGLKHGY